MHGQSFIRKEEKTSIEALVLGAADILGKDPVKAQGVQLAELCDKIYFRYRDKLSVADLQNALYNAVDGKLGNLQKLSRNRKISYNLLCEIWDAKRKAKQKAAAADHQDNHTQKKYKKLWYDNFPEGIHDMSRKGMIWHWMKCDPRWYDEYCQKTKQRPDLSSYLKVAETIASQYLQELDEINSMKKNLASNAYHKWLEHYLPDCPSEIIRYSYNVSRARIQHIEGGSALSAVHNFMLNDAYGWMFTGPPLPASNNVQNLASDIARRIWCFDNLTTMPDPQYQHELLYQLGCKVKELLKTSS